ncbi:MAG: HAD-IA family hydrolase [Patescibacteria group bacterium]
MEKKSILSDFSRTVLHPQDKGYTGGLNVLHKKFIEELGEKYHVLDHFAFNTELLDFYRSLTDVSVSLFTTDIIQNHPHIRPKLEAVFENIFAANDLRVSKKDPAAYVLISKKLNTNPSNIVYIDDQHANNEAARTAGMNIVHFNNDTSAVIEKIKHLLSK